MTLWYIESKHVCVIVKELPKISWFNTDYIIRIASNRDIRRVKLLGGIIPKEKEE